MGSRDNLLNENKNCSFEGADVENVYCNDTDGARRDGSIDDEELNICKEMENQ